MKEVCWICECAGEKGSMADKCSFNLLRLLLFSISILNEFFWVKNAFALFHSIFPLLLHGSISPTFYQQLLHTQIPKARKKDSQLKQFFALLGSAGVKAAHKMLVKLTPPHLSFYVFSSQSNRSQQTKIPLVQST